MISYLRLKDLNAPFLAAAQKALQSGRYLRGGYTQQFETAYAQYIGTKCCVGCGNGLDALSLIFRAYMEMGMMKEGDEVIVPANTYIASILAITENRLRPVLVEPDPDTLQIDDKRIAEALTPRTKAVMIVHLYGRCAFTQHIADICRENGLKLIEDNAQAHGCMFENRHTGALGDAAAHSFYPTKNLGALGDAGAVTTDDAALAELIRTLGNYGSSQQYVFDHLGRNSRMDEVQAAVLLEKLTFLDGWNQRRKEIACIYINKVRNGIIRIPQSVRDSVWHIFPVFTTHREELRRYLAENGVETQVHYPIPPHQQRCYPSWNTWSLPITEHIHAEEVSIPCHQLMTNEEADHVADLLNHFCV